ncbi:MAG: glycosyltransferase family 4 protein [Acidimicrobiales bacterium]
MRVLVLGDLASVHSTRWAEAVADRGHVVQRVGFGDPGSSPVPAVELGTRELSDRRYLIGLPRWWREARRFRPDVVHAHFVASYGIMAGLGGFGAPVMQFAWGSDILMMDRLSSARQHLIARTLRRASVVVVDAEDVGQSVARLAPTTPRVLVAFGPERSWTEVPVEPSTRILSPRNLRPLYNVRTIVDAFTRIAPDAPEWRLDVLTGGDDPGELAALVSAAGLDRRVEFHPRLSRAELQQRFVEAEIVVSVPSSDGTSVALLEGMASGAFPIVSDLAANRAWVTDGVNGSVVAPGDVDGLADALSAAIGDEALRRAVALDNRRLIAEKGCWERAVDAVDQATRQVSEGVLRRRDDSQRSAS